jgi:hypothetical protein
MEALVKRYPSVLKRSREKERKKEVKGQHTTT